jgi:hypothetical protein
VKETFAFMLSRLRNAALLALIAATLIAGAGTASTLVAVAAQPKESPTPTPVPTPYLALELIPNGTWQIIIQGRDIQYSSMKLKAAGTAITGLWTIDKKTAYVVNGVRDGTHLKLDLKTSDAQDAAVVGKVDATLDGIADMFGIITLNGLDMPFQGAQHSRVPAPVDAGSPAPGGQGPPGSGLPGGYPH